MGQFLLLRVEQDNITFVDIITKLTFPSETRHSCRLFSLQAGNATVEGCRKSFNLRESLSDGKIFAMCRMGHSDIVLISSLNCIIIPI